jgi:mannose-6-phosphate isomerase
MSQAQRIEPRFVERVWGTTDLTPHFPASAERIGEVWFQAPDGYPLLVKFIFTTERLSVQVHPGDKYAREHENSSGKTEMWHILGTEPDASIAVGFKAEQTEAAVRDSIASGHVEDLLEWQRVKPGENYFISAGVVHAIGAGIRLCEIQQSSDVTYRLYDYGRPRELHLEKGLAVASLAPYDSKREFPIGCSHFRAEWLEFAEPEVSQLEEPHLLITLEGSGTIDEQKFGPSEVWLVRDGRATIEPAEPTQIIRSYVRET